MPALSEVVGGYICDCNKVRIDLMLESDPLDPKVFFLDDSPILDPRTAFLRDLKYIQVIGGTEPAEDYLDRPIQRTTLRSGKFAVIPDQFFRTVQSFLQLQRFGTKWKSAGKDVNAGLIKQKIQAALVPFGISDREITALYKQLQIHCFNSDAVVEPFKFSDLRSKVYERPPFIVDRFMCPGLILFAAPSKTGKSFLALDLACSIAEGKPFWNFQTSAGSVCYLDLEGSDARTQERIVGIGRKSKQDVPERLFVTHEARNTDEGLLNQIEMWTNAVPDPKLVIIDTLELVKGKSARNETSYSADYRIMKPLHDLALEKGIAILAITHTRKGTGYELDDVFDQIIGSTAQMGASDASWIIHGKRGSDTKTFTATGRDFESVEFEIERGAGGKWIFKGTTEEIQEELSRNGYQDDPVVKVIRQQLTGSGGSWKTTAQNVLEELWRTGDFSIPDATRMAKHIRELAQLLMQYDNILVRLPDPHGGKKGRIFTFEQMPFTK